MNGARTWRCALALGCIFALWATSAARGETFEEHAAAILHHAWRPAPDALAAATTAHAAAVLADADDHRADYSLALAQMRANQWDAAIASVANATRKSPQDVYAWRAHLWLLLYQRQYPAALAEIERFAKTFPPAADSDPQAEARRVAAAKVMGRALGYIAGPRSGAVPADQLAALEAQLAAKLTPQRQAAFDAGKAEMVAAHAAALAAIDAEKQAVVELKEDEKAAQSEFVQSERSRIESESAAYAAQATSAKDQLSAELQGLDQQLTPIQQRYTEVQFTAQPYVTRIGQLDRQLSFALAEANRNDAGDGKDPERVRRDRERRDRARRDADLLSFEIRREQEFLRPLQLESQRLQAAAALVEQRKAAALAAYQRTIGGLEAELRKLERVEKQLRISERDLAKPAASTSAKTADLKARLPLLTTYEKFPLEQERLRLLKEFGAQ